MMNKQLLLTICIIASFVIFYFPNESKSEVRQGHVITKELLTCKTDEDCILVPIGCDGCCIYDAINKTQEETYYKLFNRSCKGYSGPVCDCLPASEQGYKEEAICMDQLCTRLETPINK